MNIYKYHNKITYPKNSLGPLKHLKHRYINVLSVFSLFNPYTVFYAQLIEAIYNKVLAMFKRIWTSARFE